MTGGNFSVRYKGGNEESDQNVQVALDQVASKLRDIEDKIPDIENRPEVGQQTVNLSASRNLVLDPQGRLLTVSGRAPKENGPVRYRLFSNSVGISSDLSPSEGLSSAVQLSIGKQWDTFHDVYSGDTGYHRRIELNAFMGIAYNVPWHGNSVPNMYTGPFIRGAAPRCGKVYVSGAEAANPEGASHKMRDNNIIGTWDPTSGLSTLSTFKINSTSDANTYIDLVEAPETAMQWGVMPFFFEPGEENELKKFLEDLFYCNPNNSVVGGDDGSPGATGIGDGFVQACLTTRNSFPMLVWSQLLLGVSADKDYNRSSFWTAQTVNYPGNLNADRAKWTIDVIGTQDIVVA